MFNVDVDFDADISYNHPNGMYTFTIKNNTKEEIKGGSVTVKGQAKLCFSGVKHVTLNGEYIIDVEIPKNSGATSYNLFENNKPIKTAQVNPKDNLLKWTESFKKKEAGKYQYRLDLINSEGITSSDALQIEVAKENKLLIATLKSNTGTTDTGSFNCRASKRSEKNG